MMFEVVPDGRSDNGNVRFRFGIIGEGDGVGVTDGGPTSELVAEPVSSGGAVVCMQLAFGEYFDDFSLQ